jgi:E3 ubiquitin-protein ligase synoviolin
LDLVSDFLKLLVYVSFFMILMNFYGLPLHIIRDLCNTFKRFFSQVQNFLHGW